MEQNLFAEQIVSRKTDKATIFKKLATLLAFGIIFFIVSSIPALMPFMSILCIGILFIAIVTVRSFNLEYEYILAEGEFSVDVIRGKSRRARKLTISLSRTIAFLPSADPRAAELSKNASRRFDFSSADGASGTMALLADSQNGQVFLIIEPNEKMYSHIVSALPGSVRMSLKNND